MLLKIITGTAKCKKSDTVARLAAENDGAFMRSGNSFPFRREGPFKIHPGARASERPKSCPSAVSPTDFRTPGRSAKI